MAGQTSGRSCSLGGCRSREMARTGTPEEHTAKLRSRWGRGSESTQADLFHHFLKLLGFSFTPTSSTAVPASSPGLLLPFLLAGKQRADLARGRFASFQASSWPPAAAGQRLPVAWVEAVSGGGSGVQPLLTPWASAKAPRRPWRALGRQRNACCCPPVSKRWMALFCMCHKNV